MRAAFLDFLPLSKANASLTIVAQHPEGRMLLTWACIPEVTYFIQSSADFIAWQNETQVTPTGSLVTLAIPVDFTLGRRLFRLRMTAD